MIYKHKKNKVKTTAGHSSTVTAERSFRRYTQQQQQKHCPNVTAKQQTSWKIKLFNFFNFHVYDCISLQQDLSLSYGSIKKTSSTKMAVKDTRSDDK